MTSRSPRFRMPAISAARCARGVTLIELMTAIIIIGLIAAMAVPAFVSTSNSNRLSGLGNDVAGVLQAMRLEAVRTGRRAIICPTTDNTTCTAGEQWGGWLGFVDLNGNGVPNPDEIRRTDLVRLPLQLWASDAITDGGNRVVFRPDGFTYDAAGVLIEATLAACIETTRPPENVRTVRITAAGSVTVFRADGGGACAAPTDS